VVTVIEGTKLKLSGWVDTTFQANEIDDDKAKFAKMNTGFSATGSLKAEFTFANDKVRAFSNLWYYSDVQSLQTREAYVSIKLPAALTLTTGKYINHIGWISAEPTGLYTVNSSVIGYTGAYANDVIGATLAWASDKVDASVHITNGYFSAADASNRTTAPAGRKPSGLGYGADVTAKPVEGVSLNAEWAYDQTSANTTADTVGGDIWQVGLNGTLKGFKGLEPLTVGVEWIYRETLASKTAGERNRDGSFSDQVMLLVNYALPSDKTAFPMSITGMIQHIRGVSEAGTTLTHETNTSRATEYAVALLTNPFKVTNLGVNAEVAWVDAKDVNGGVPTSTETKTKGPVFTLEAIASF
jgi:hypothetical protein